MPDATVKGPTWEDYEYGRSPRQGSTGSLGSHVQFDAQSPPPGSDRLNLGRQNGDREGASEVLRRRRYVSKYH